MSASALAYRINTVHEVAPWGRSTTYKLVRDGHLPAKRLGGATFVLREELELFIKNLPSAVGEDLSASAAVEAGP